MIWPTHCYVGVSQDVRTVRVAAFCRIKICWTHAFLAFHFEDPDGAVCERVFEADWAGLHFSPWDKAHQADGWALFADDRMTPQNAALLWAFCLGAEGKVYEWPLLVRLALRLIRQAWGFAKRRVIGRGGIAQVCSSLVNEASRAIFGEAYADRPDPSPDEIVVNSHLHLHQEGET